MIGRLRNRKVVPQRTPGELDAMAVAGALVAKALAAVREAAAPGVSTKTLDEVAEAVIRDGGGVPSFLGYHGYPATICSSVNDRVVHGIPSADEILAPGDLVSIDCGAIVDGWHGDSAVSVVLGPPDELDLQLVETTRASMWAGIAALHGEPRLGAVGEAVEDAVEQAVAEGANGGRPYGIVEEYTGHGIGSAMHQPPDVLNYRTRDRGPRVRAGMCLAVEPMVVRGSAAVHELADEWTVVTDDGSRAAHWEHTVAVTEDGPRILTLRPE